MATMDNLSDQLLSTVFENLTDLADFRNCRLVSQKWKHTAMNTCKNKFHVVYPLTDSTLHTASELKGIQVSFDIYAFTGQESKGAWRTSGIEPLMRTTEWLQFSGSEVSPSEIRKILGLAHNSLKTLSFKGLQKDLMPPFLTMQQTFSALRKLSLGYYSIEKHNEIFNTFTSTLELWSSLDCGVQLPLLESLNLYFDGRAGDWYQTSDRVSTEDLFRNYMAIANLLLKYKQTLRLVQIERVGVCVNYLYSLHLIRPKWSEIERGLEALDEMNLSRLKVSTKTSSVYGRNYDVGVDIFGRPKNLKNVLFNHLVCPFDNWCPLMATLSSFNNVDGVHLTSLKIDLVLREFPDDPTLVINLGELKECKNLRTLGLSVNSTNIRVPLLVRNVELLPKGISTLRFESTDVNRYMMGKEILVNQQQLRWIIDNLRGLESFRMSLVILEQMNNDRREDTDEDNNAQRQQEHLAINRLANINLETFRDLLAIPKLKDVKVDMMKAAALSITAGQRQVAQWAGQGTTLDDVREFANLCQASGYITNSTTSQNFGADNVFGFATLTAQKN